MHTVVQQIAKPGRTHAPLGVVPEPRHLRGHRLRVQELASGAAWLEEAATVARRAARSSSI